MTVPPKQNIHEKIQINDTNTTTIPSVKHTSDDLADLQWLATALDDFQETVKSPELNTPVLCETLVQNNWITIDQIGNVDDTDIPAF